MGCGASSRRAGRPLPFLPKQSAPGTVPASPVYSAQRRNGAGWGGVRGLRSPAWRTAGTAPRVFAGLGTSSLVGPVKCPWSVRRVVGGVGGVSRRGTPRASHTDLESGSARGGGQTPPSQNLVPSLSRATPRPRALSGARGRLPTRGVVPVVPGVPGCGSVWIEERWGVGGGSETPSFPPRSDLSCVSAEGLAERRRKPCRAAAAAATACR